jgi:hypothetical protein
MPNILFLAVICSLCFIRVTAIECATNLTAVRGSQNIEACGCADGMYYETDLPVTTDGVWKRAREGTVVGWCMPCPVGSVSVEEGIAIHSCICDSTTSVMVEGGCVEACHLTDRGCACHLNSYGELVDCGDVVDADPGLSSGAPSVFSKLEFGVVHACAISYPLGHVLCWNIVDTAGEHSMKTHLQRPQSKAPPFISGAQALSLGVEHSCALWGADGTVTCWGSPGVIGRESVVKVSRNVRMLAVGHPASRHVCFLYVSKMFVSCTGLNTQNQLGLGMGAQGIYQLHAEDIVSYL